MTRRFYQKMPGREAEGRRRAWKCRVCGMLPDAPMLNDDLWSTVASKTDMLCIDCLETLLGRELTVADLKLAPVNLWFFRFYDRLMGAP